MAFWSSQTLENRLSELIKPAIFGAIDCNAVTLHVGHEYYSTPSLELSAPNLHTKTLLADSQPFAIPAGQFAFLLTEESVHVPADAMAFISMKARMKFRGLVNVSGFHVDPNWSGPLIFAVFNAGPSTVHLQQGMPLFLIWYADLDYESVLRRKMPGPTTIPPELINNITGEVLSFSSLDKKIEDKTKNLSDRVHAVEKDQVRIQVIAGIVLAVLVGMIGFALRGVVEDLWGSSAVSAPPAAFPSQSTSPITPPISAPPPSPKPEERTGASPPGKSNW